MNEMINRLLDLSNEALVSNEKCLTIYYTIKNYSERAVEKELKSVFEASIEESENTLLKNNSKYLLNLFLRRTMDLRDSLNGLGLFFKFSKKSLDQRNHELDLHNLSIVFSSYSPITKVSLGNIFDLSIVTAMLRNPKYLFINISKESIEIYEYLNNQILLLKRIEIEIKESLEDRFSYLQKTSRHMGSGNILTSSSNIHEKQDKFTRKILNRLIEELKSLPSLRKSYEQIFVVCSSEFINEKKYLSNSLKYLSDGEVIVTQENIDNKKDLEERVPNIIKEYNELELTRELEASGKRIDRVLTTDFNEIVENIRIGNVFKLFIKEGSKKNGFVENNYLPCSDNIENTSMVEDVYPYIAKKTMESGGEIELLEKSDKRIDNDLALIPRY